MPILFCCSFLICIVSEGNEKQNFSFLQSPVNFNPFAWSWIRAAARWVGLFYSYLSLVMSSSLLFFFFSLQIFENFRAVLLPATCELKLAVAATAFRPVPLTLNGSLRTCAQFSIGRLSCTSCHLYNGCIFKVNLYWQFWCMFTKSPTLHKHTQKHTLGGCFNKATKLF